jgi:uncharacterized protein (DUF779 family)
VTFAAAGKVSAAPAALALLAEIVAEHGPVMFHQSGGMFSLDNGRERRFLTRSRVCGLPQNP